MNPRTCQALVVRVQDDKPALVKENITFPIAGPGQVLVRVQYAAQNPTDVQSFDGNVFGDGAILGCDYAGTVEALGPDVTRLKVGDTVAGLIWGGEVKGNGAYCEYLLAYERICFRVPEGFPLEQAVTVPLAACTSWLALYASTCLGIPRGPAATKKEPVLIWGGSSSVGLYAIQLAVLNDMEVVTTCSPRNFDLVRAHGATHVFDYSDADVATKIQDTVKIKYLFDTIGSENSSALGSQALVSGGKMCTVRPGKSHTQGVKPEVTVTDVLVFTAFNKPLRYGEHVWAPSGEDHKLAADFYEQVPQWLLEGKLKTNKPKVYDGGLDDIEAGFQLYRDGKISGYKLVYKLA